MATREEEPRGQDIARRLRMAREMAGLSQAQVALKLGVHRPTVSQIEAGRRKVSAEELVQLSQLYEVGLSWLAGTEEEPAEVGLAARELRKLKAEDVKVLLQLLKALRTPEEPDR